MHPKEKKDRPDKEDKKAPEKKKPTEETSNDEKQEEVNKNGGWPDIDFKKTLGCGG
ncbi:MAG: hypothetical protein ABJ004_03730 [Cyclobacteriaceae bacterium]